MNPAIFLDRDGTLTLPPPEGYVLRPEQINPIPAALDAVAELTARGWLLFVVSNQSAVGRGWMTEEAAVDCMLALDSAVRAAGGSIVSYRFCPHTPDHNCTCRKPRPGLLFWAQTEYLLDLRRSWMVGDRLLDAQAGNAAGCQSVILTRTSFDGKLTMEAQARWGEYLRVADYRANHWGDVLRIAGWPGLDHEQGG